MNERLPFPQEALEILVKNGCTPTVINHCKTVATLAKEIAENCRKKGANVNVRLVEVGALLHDVGRSKTHNVNHPIVGADIARRFNMPENVVNIIERHLGGGISIDEAKQLGWPIKSYLPQTLEEKIVSYADKLIEGTQMVPIEQTLQSLSEKLGKEHPAIGRIRAIHEEIASLIGDPDVDNDHTA